MDILFAEDSFLWTSQEGTTFATPQCEKLKSCKCWDITLNWATSAFFHILSNPFFTNHLII